MCLYIRKRVNIFYTFLKIKEGSIVPLGPNHIMVSVLLVEVLLVGNLLVEEEKYPNAEMLLCTSLYTKKDIVLEKYIFLLLVFAYCCIAYNTVGFILPSVEPLDIELILTVLLITTILFGVFMPLQFKIRIQRTKLYLSIRVFAIPLLLTSVKDSSVTKKIFG